MYSLTIKGNLEEVRKQCKERGYEIVKVHSEGKFETTVIIHLGKGMDRNNIYRYYNETMLIPPPFPAGTLMLFREVDDELYQRA